MYSFRKARILIPTLSWRKVVNFIMLWSSFHYSRFRGKPSLWGRPAKAGMEPTTHCNLRCPECISGLRAFTRPTGMMQLETFKKFVDEAGSDLIYLLMYFQGEPFLNPDFLKLVEYASLKKIYVATSTNGHYLNAEMAEKTIASGISEVIISIDGINQESYVSYRVGGDLEKVKAGVKNLRHARDKAKSLSPVIYIQFLVFRKNEHEIEEIKKLGLELGADKVLLKTAQINDFEHGSPFMPANSNYSRYRKKKDGTYAIKNPLLNQCWRMWMGPEITWDGKVLPCCFDKDGKSVMGELENSNFSKIWKSDAYQNFRVDLLKSRKSIPMCTNCSEGTKVWS